ncbi:hypothetical protein V1517DRAFT_329206 [Lipomyces orientalis]|uniref:Uncharacterized protein n=1 Tax=Lipomyces orientalis TaxID=1233043 RepID=A0ACC3TK64_9ASCO
MSLSAVRLYNLIVAKYPKPTASDAEAPVTPLKLGILSAAAIAPRAVINPAKLMPEKVQIYSVAARDPARAKEFAKKYGIPHAHDSYEDLIADPEVEAVYIPLPNGLHYEWTLKCIELGKPVLLEKPATSNAAQAEKLFEIAKEQEVLIVEAFHWWFHPAAKLVKEIVRNKEEFGEVEKFEGSLCVSHFFKDDDIRFDFALAGGSLMDMGCYPISWMRYYLGENPVAAKSLELEVYPKDAKIDGFASVEYSFASSEKKKAIVHCGLRTPLSTLWRIGFIPKMIITSSKKDLVYTMPLWPHVYHNISVRDISTGKVENQSCFVEGKETWSTYAFQLEAFADSVKGGKTVPLFSSEDSVENMKAVDMAYEAVGLPLRS